MKEQISPQQLLQPSEKIFVTGYSVVEKEDVFESIIAQVVEIQKDLEIYDADDDIEINIENKEDLRFINSLRNAYACYVLEGNRKVITSQILFNNWYVNRTAVIISPLKLFIYSSIQLFLL